MLELDDLKEKHDKAYNHGDVTREQAANDLVFYHVTQWDENLLSTSSLQYRGQFDVLRKAGRDVLSGLRANPVQVDFKPKADSRDDGADFLDGLYRSDDRNNQSIEAYNVASQESVVCGVGAWLLYTEYETNALGDLNQVIRRKPLYEANNKVFWDPNAKLQDKSDAKYVSIIHAYSEDGYLDLVEELTGEERSEINKSNFKSPEQSYTFPWYSESSYVYVSEFYYREKVKSKIYAVMSQTSQEPIFVTQREVDENEDAFVDGYYEIVGEKEVEIYQVTRYIASGAEILSEEVIAGQHIPVVPVYGERAFVEDEEYYEGITRLAKDPQRLRNFQMSYLADIVSRSPRRKPIYYPEQIQGYEDMYEESGADSNYPYALMNPMTVNGEALPPGAVGETPEQPVPQSLLMLNDLSRQAIEDVANPGTPQDLADPDLSGKAVIALQNKIDKQTMVYQDSLKHAKRRDGVIYASMAAEVYDAPRRVTLTLPDGQTKVVQVMETVLNPETGEFTTLNDITNIEFDVYSDIGPSYSNQKEQTLDRLRDMMEVTPPQSPIFEMLQLQYIQLMDGVSLEAVREYANKQLILKGYKEPETEEEIAFAQQAAQAANQPDPASQAMLMEGQARLQEGQAAILNEENDRLKLALDERKLDLQAQEVAIKAAEAGVSMDKARAETRGKEIDNLLKFQLPRTGQNLRPTL